MMWALLWRRYCAGALLSDVFQRRCSWKGAGEESDRWVLVPDICISLSYKSRPQPPTRTNTAPYIIRRRTRRVMSPRLSVVGDEIFPENMKPSLPNNETFTSEIILMRAIINVLRLRRWDCRTFYCLLLLYHSSLQIPTWYQVSRRYVTVAAGLTELPLRYSTVCCTVVSYCYTSLQHTTCYLLVVWNGSVQAMSGPFLTIKQSRFVRFLSWIRGIREKEKTTHRSPRSRNGKPLQPLWSYD